MLITLGCFRNEVESDIARSELAAIGMEEVRELESAQVVIVNTCGFIREACEEGIDTILELDLRASGPGRPPILLIGCMGQRFGADLLTGMGEVSGVLGVDWRDNLSEALLAIFQGGRFHRSSATPCPAQTARTVDSSSGATLFVRIADGCDRACRFCAIPSIRGHYRSRHPDEIYAEIERLAGDSERELVLLAQDVTSYGRDLPGQPGLAELVGRLAGMKAVRWLRLLYMSPEGVTQELVSEMVENPVVCDYFDIPFQHASKSVLRRMGRPGDVERYCELIASIRSRSPGAALRTTVMVGYPGETEQDFEELVRFVEKIRFDWLGAFRYSQEEGTKAALLGGNVQPDIARARYDTILNLQDAIEASRVRRRIGREFECVIDGESDIAGYDLRGRSYMEAPVVDGSIYIKRATAAGAVAAPGDFTKATITGQEGLDLVGEI